ncbi:hypothetical protein A4D02_13430 [Niastella koreensis]|uniref:Uncharacterized protein n=2 Tax=Niastella koreensis TaxID=354356 RepID=G8TNM7_NIAKG|nr:hypothetical protein [Niastella koreensis]AEW00953.1 hypothetical protein Niako_4697 [Niastella koreensis GR20-10]OQP42562.1 hypothetical protein A4D02_13430 [Niastella koreensis]
MSLTNIKLPGFVIADLYRNSLIQPEEGALPQQETAKTKTVTPPPMEGDGGEPAEPVAIAQPIQQTEPVVYKTLGNNKQQISVVVNCPNDVYVPEADLQFLTKMLGACKLNMADVAIVNYASAPVAIDRLKTQLQPKFLLLFGVEPGDIQLPISFPPFKEQPYAGTTYLFTPPLSQLNQETEEAKLLKRKLWDCLKRMFF